MSVRRIIRGSRLMTGAEGVTLIEPYDLYDLSRSASLMIAALNDPELPKIGEGHPDAAGMFCEAQEILPWANSKTKAKALLTYRSTRIYFHGIGSNELTHFDLDGIMMQVEWSPDNTSRIVRKQPVELPVLRVGSILGFKRVVAANGSRNPNADAVKFFGAINSDYYLLQNPYTWKCVKYEVNEVSGTSTGPWFEEIEFEFRGRAPAHSPDKIIEDHRQIALYIDPKTRIVPQNVHPAGENGELLDDFLNHDEGNGWGRFITNHTRDFNELGLPVVSFD